MPKPLAPIHPTENDTGEVAAAMKNREISLRLQIMRALQRLGIPYPKWPDFVKSFYENPKERAGFSASISPPPFQAPEFDWLKQSLEQWEKAAHKAWRQHLDSFKERYCQYPITQGVDMEIPPREACTRCRPERAEAERAA